MNQTNMQRVIVDSVPKSVVPLFLQIGSEFRYWGTGTLFRFDKAFFIVTAGHVISGERGNDNLVMQGWNGRLIETPDHWLRTRIPTNGSPEHDRNDIAVALLTEAMVAGFFQRGYGFLGEETLYPLPLYDEQHVVFTGFPGDTQTCIHDSDFSLVHLRPAAFHSKVVRATEARSLGFDGDQYIVAEYRPPAQQPMDKRALAVPRPPGMSGGAVYLYENNRPVGFVGITHRWLTSPGLLVATRAVALVPMMQAELEKNPSAFRIADTRQ